MMAAASPKEGDTVQHQRQRPRVSRTAQVPDYALIGEIVLYSNGPSHVMIAMLTKEMPLLPKLAVGSGKFSGIGA